MAKINADEISKILREQIENYEQTVSVDEVGSVISVGDGIARVHGLEKVMAGEMLAFPHDIFGIALNLEEEEVGVVLLGESSELQEGDIVKRTNTHYVGAGRRSDGWPRSESAGRAARRQRPYRHRSNAIPWSASLPAWSIASRCASRCRPVSRPSTP